MTSWFLAISIFMFGVLKFVNPFQGWYRVQIENSELGQLSYTTGRLGEVVVGITLILSLLFRQKISTKSYNRLSNVSFLAIIIMMLTAVYVHLRPNVPADVLPLKIKPPYIPLFFLLIALSNLVLTIKSLRRLRRRQKTSFS